MRCTRHDVLFAHSASKQVAPLVVMSSHARTERDRRAVAMLLVLVSLAGATILTAAYLASRDNSAIIGANVAASAEARWGAQTGLDTGLAILETQADWRTMHVNGRIVSGLVIGNTSIDVDLVDLQTGAAPAATTTNVGILATATANGVAQVASATVIVPLAGGLEIDLGLSEFATMVTDQISLSDNATITRWPSSPLAGMGRRVALATQSPNAGSITLFGDAAALDSTVFAPPGAPGPLVINGATGPDLQEIRVFDPIPMPAPPAVPVAPKDLATPPPSIDFAGPVVLTTDTRYDDFMIQGTGTVTLTGTIDVVADKTLTLQDGANVYVDGDVTLVIFEDLVMHAGSSIELEPGATLRLFVGHQVQITDGFIGPRRTDDTMRDASGDLAWDDPERTRIYGVTPAANWAMQSNSVVVGTLYAPGVALTIAGTSSLYGSSATQSLVMTDDTAIFYDHGLDSSSGYTNPESALFDADGRIVAPVMGLVSLDTVALQAVADALGTTVTISGQTVSPTVPPVPPADDPSEPTPRTVHVTYEAKTLGSDVDDWEKTNDQGTDLFKIANE